MILLITDFLIKFFNRKILLIEEVNIQVNSNLVLIKSKLYGRSHLLLKKESLIFILPLRLLSKIPIVIQYPSSQKELNFSRWRTINE